MKHPLLIAGAAVVGLLYVRKVHAANASIAPTASSKQVAYVTPTGVAEQLGQFVVGMLRGVTPSDPKGIFSTPASLPDQFDSETARLARQAGAPGTDAAARYAVGPADWSLPSLSLGSDASVSRFGSSVDQIAAAPVYNVGTDFQQNPLATFGSNPFGWLGDADPNP
jgi:hypothetical protein